MKKRLPQWPKFDSKSIARVAAIIRSGKVNAWAGDEVSSFEKEFAAAFSARGAVAVSSGTAALHLALSALGVGPGDEVVATPLSFIASSNCAYLAGAKPVFADVGEDHMLSAETIAKAITPRTKAIVVVHLFGQVADMGPILKLAREKKLYVVEDCAQCLGGLYKGRAVGTLGDVGCFSFCQTKHITTGGEGGMVVARSKRVSTIVRSLRDHGWKVGSQPKAYERVGYNFRMTEIQAALGRGELARFETWNRPRRNLLAGALIRGLSASPSCGALIRNWPVDTRERQACFWLVPFVLDASRLKCSVSAFIDRLQAAGVGAYKIIWPLPEKLPVAARLMRETVGFWVHPTYSLRDVKNDIMAFEEAAKDCIGA